MGVEFVTSREAAGLTAYIFNKVRKNFPELKIGKAKVVKDELPRSGVVISNSTERGVVLKARAGIDLEKFWNKVSDEVKVLRNSGKNTYPVRHLIK